MANSESEKQTLKLTEKDKEIIMDAVKAEYIETYESLKHNNNEGYMVAVIVHCALERLTLKSQIR